MTNRSRFGFRGRRCMMSLSAFSYASDTDGNWPGAERTGAKGLPGPLTPALWSSPRGQRAGVGLRLGSRTCSDHTATPACTAWAQLTHQERWHVHSTSVLVSIRISAFISSIACSLLLCLPPFCLLLFPSSPAPCSPCLCVFLGYSGLGLFLLLTLFLCPCLWSLSP